MSCAGSAKGSVKLRSPMVLCTYGSRRARGEREERAGAQSLLCVVSSISCAEPCVCVFITGEGESQNKEKQIWSYEERR